MSARKKTVYLSERNVSRIMAVIKKTVTESYEKSPLGVEAKIEMDKFRAEYMRMAYEFCPQNEIEVLKKWEVHSQSEDAYIICKNFETSEQSFEVWRRSSFNNGDKSVRVIFEFPFVSGGHYKEQFMKKVSLEMDKGILACVFIANYKMKCEITSIIEAYSAYISKFKTVRQLIEDNPEMEKFIPSDVFAEPEKKVSEGTKDIVTRIATFEGMLREDEKEAVNA